MNIKNFEIIPPYKDWRKGQTLYNFLEYLHIEKGYPNVQSYHMADPFNIPDDELNKLYDEYCDFVHNME